MARSRPRADARFLGRESRQPAGVVKEEIRVNVKNRPYGLFFWTDLIALAFDKWENAHDGYGSFADLDAANLEDVKSFHATYYAPGNAVVGVAGDVIRNRSSRWRRSTSAAFPPDPHRRGPISASR